MSWFKCSVGRKKEIIISGFSCGAPDKGGAYGGASFSIPLDGKFKTCNIEEIKAYGSGGYYYFNGYDENNNVIVSDQLINPGATIYTKTYNIEGCYKLSFSIRIGQPVPINPQMGGYLKNIVIR